MEKSKKNKVQDVKGNRGRRQQQYKSQYDKEKITRKIDSKQENNDREKKEKDSNNESGKSK